MAGIDTVQLFIALQVLATFFLVSLFWAFRSRLGRQKFFSPEPPDPNEDLPGVREKMGVPPGHVIERKPVEEKLKASEKDYRSLFESANDPIFIFEPENEIILAANQQAYEIYGYSGAELTGKSFKKLTKDVRRGEQQLAELVEKGSYKNFETVHFRKDGTEIEMLVSSSMVEYAGKKAVLSINRDVTEFNRAQRKVGKLNQDLQRLLVERTERLRQSESLFDTLAVASPVGIFRTDAAGQCVYVNQRWCELAGLPESEALGDGWAGAVHPDDRQMVFEEWSRAARAGRPFSLEFQFQNSDGTIAWIYGQALPEKDEEGKVIGYIGAVTDLTEQKKATEEQREREKRLLRQSRVLAKLTTRKTPRPGSLAEGLGEITEAAARTLQVERAGVWLFNADRTSVRCADLFELQAQHHSRGQELAATDFPNYFAKIEERRAIAANEVHTDPLTREFSQSYFLPLGISSVLDAPIRLEGKTVGVVWHEHVGPARHWTPDEIHFAGSIADIVSLVLEGKERQQAEAALRESNDRFEQLAEAIQDVFWMTELDGFKAVYVSPAYERIWQRPLEKLYQDTGEWAQGIHPEDRDRVWESFQKTGERGSYEEEYRVLRPDGTIRWIHDRGVILDGPGGQSSRVAGIAQDVTAQRILQEQFLQSQKMEMVGQLASGLAHDFNNLLSVILGYSELLQPRLEAAGVNQSAVSEIRKAAERATRLTRQLLAFSRKQVMQPKVLDLNTVVADMEEMMRRLIGEHIKLQARPGVNLEAVKADPGQMEQVLLNLAVNARDAMPEGGVLTIETANVELDEAYARTNPGMKPGQYVLVAVSDTGMGMDEETLLHIFEPFFTTKGVGKGTGLGLATVYGIIKQSGGYLWVHSEPGKGTTFKVYLPVAEEIEEGDVTTSLPEPATGGAETILLVEDEKAVRELSRKMLEKSGYAVLGAADGKEALEIAKTYQGDIHILISDVIMPEMSGTELAEATRMLRPEMKVLFVSGYTDERLLPQGEMVGELPFLQKPFTLGTLSQKVRETLDGNQEDSPSTARRRIPQVPGKPARGRARNTVS